MLLARFCVAVCLVLRLLPGGAARAVDPTLEVGRPFLQNFGLRDYHAHNQNWAAAQDAQGIIYFGNKGVVLEYDGVSWRKIVVAQTTFVRGLASDPRTGTIFVGAVDELGYLQTNPDGEKTFVSLLSQLPAEARGFRDIRRVFSSDNGIYFVADQQVMRWRNDRFQTWKLPNSGTLRGFWVNNRLFVQNSELGLLRLDDNDKFVSASPDPCFHRAQVTVCVPGATGGVVVATGADGLMTLRDDGTVVPLTSDAAEFFKTGKVRWGLRLHDGSLVVAVSTGGIVVLDREGHFHARLDEASGLQNDLVRDLYEDRENGLWLCLNSGVTRVEVSSNLSIFGRENGMRPTTVHSLTRYRGNLYLATNDGVYRVVPAEPAAARMAYCEFLPETPHDCWSLLSTDHGLIAGGGGGVSLFDGEGHLVRSLLTGVDTYFMKGSRVHPERIFIGTRKGLRALRYEAGNDRWVDEGLLTSAEVEGRSLVETAAGDLWIGTGDQGIYRISAPGSGTPASVTQFLGTHGLPANQSWTRVTPWSGPGGVLFATQPSFYRFDESAQTFRVVPDYGARFTNDTFEIGEVTDDPTGLWLSGRAKTPDGWADQEIGQIIPTKDGADAIFRRLPYKVADRIGEIENIFVEPGPAGEIVWVSGTDGAVRVEAAGLQKQATAPFPTLLRRAATTSGNASGKATAPILGPGLPYARNSVHFEFAADTFAFGAAVRYQTRLQGFGPEHWSSFTDRTAVDYTNLPEGRYVFQVRARDVDFRMSIPASLPLHVLPPWQRSPLAYLAYGILAVIIVVGIAQWRSRHLRARTVELEEIVSARTEELSINQGELRRARDSAETSNRAKSAFLANMSHELRTPLNAILGYTQIMLKDRALSARNRERLTVVGQSGGHLLAMINEVLDLSKIEAGKQTLNQTDFSPGQLLDEVSAVFRPRLAEKGLNFRCVRPPTLPGLVHGDAGKLRQVLFNLLGNAVKFTQSGEVHFEVSAAGDDRMRFEVRDTGVGIAEADLREVFVAFHQVGGHGLSAQGTGLGLAISQRFVEMLGGRLEVESKLGQGSRFWFELALAPVMAEHAASYGEAARDDQRPVTGFHGLPRRVLIVDDDTVVRRVLRELLEPLGFEVEEAVSGGECLERCAQHAPEVVLLDLRMAGLDGYGVARALRQNGSSVKIIAVSASVFESDRQQAVAAGCDDFLPKPFKEEQLLGTLGRLLKIEWIYGSPITAGESAADGSITETAPPSEEIDAMLELSRRGDILGIKKRLGAMQAAGGEGWPSFVRGLEPLVASYQMDRIRDVLIKCKQNGNV